MATSAGGTQDLCMLCHDYLVPFHRDGRCDLDFYWDPGPIINRLWDFKLVSLSFLENEGKLLRFICNHHKCAGQ